MSRDHPLIHTLLTRVRAHGMVTALLLRTDGPRDYPRQAVRTAKWGRPSLVPPDGVLVTQVVKQYAKRRVTAGATVIWRNYTPDLQTVTCDPPSAARPWLMVLPAGVPAWDSADLHAGDTFAHTFTVPGAYTCASSRDRNGRFVDSITVRP